MFSDHKPGLLLYDIGDYEFRYKYDDCLHIVEEFRTW